MVRRMVDRFLRSQGYWRWPISWAAKGDEVARANRWTVFFNEEGGLSEMLESIRRGYFEKAATLKPGDIDGLLALSLADRIVGEIDGQVRMIIVAGEQAAQQRAHADRIAKLPEAMRRRL